jgi:hypothetical protein
MPAGRPPPEKLMADGSNGVPLKGDPSASGWQREREVGKRKVGGARESWRGNRCDGEMHVSSSSYDM